MLVKHNGNILNVTNKFTLGQLLKYGAVEIVEEAETVTEEAVEVIEKPEAKEPKKSARKK